MAENLSVGGVTNTTYVAGGTNTTQRTTMSDLLQKKIDLLNEQNEITQKSVEQYRKAEAKRLGLPENATMEQIREQQRKNEAKRLGLPENATEDDIRQERLKRGMSIYV